MLSGFQGYKTCGLPRVAVERTFDILGRYKKYNSSGDTDDFFLGNYIFDNEPKTDVSTCNKLSPLE